MDGSVANATAVRIGQQLQNRFSSNIAGTQQALFEELLKVPVSTTMPSMDDAVAEPEVAESPAADGKTTDDKQDAAQVESASKVDEDREPDEESVVNTSLMAATMIAPVTQTETVDDAPKTDGALLESAPVLTENSQLQTDSEAIEQAPVEVSSALEATTADSAPELEVQATTTTVEPVESVVTSNEASTAGTSEVADVEVERKARTIDTTPVQDSTSNASSVVEVDQSGDQSDQSGTEFTEASQEQEQPVVAQDNVENERSDSRNDREKWYLKEDASGLSDGPSSSPAAADSVDTNAKSEAAPADLAAVAKDDSATQGSAPVDSTQVASSFTPATDPSLLAGLTMAQNAMGGAQSLTVGGSTAGSGASNAEGSSNTLGSGTSSIGTAGNRAADSGRAERTASDQSEAGSVRQLSQQERVRLVQRVARSFSRLGPEGGQVTLKLHPPQLGSLNVMVRIEGQSMSARLQTESSAAREVLLENLPVLRERLQEQGLTIERFQVDIANSQEGFTGSQTQNPFPGESDQGSQPARPNIDYRRLARNRERLDGVDRLAPNQRLRPVVLPPPTSLTLDIRA